MKSKLSTSGSGATVVTGSGSGSGTGAIPTENIPASSGFPQINQTPGVRILILRTSTLTPVESRKRSTLRIFVILMWMWRKLIVQLREKTEELRIQAEKALKQREEEEFNRKYRDEIFQPWGSVFFNAQFTPQGEPHMDLTYDDLFHFPHFLATSKVSTTDVSVVTRITPSVSAQLGDLDAFFNTSRRYVGDADNAPIVGELVWATLPANKKGHHLYQDIDPRTPYGALTVEMCNTDSINYRVNYRSASSSLPQRSLDSEYPH
jgi:hypothetical protein